MNLNEYKSLPYPANLWSAVLSKTIIQEELPHDWEATIEYMYEAVKSQRQREIINHFFQYKLTLEEIGEMYGISREGIRQNIIKTIRRFRHPLNIRVMKYGIARVIQMKEQHIGAWEMEGSSNSNTLEPTDSSYLNRIPLDELSLPNRVYNCLRRNGISTIGLLLNYTSNDLMKMRNMGNGGINIIKASLENVSLRLKSN